MTKLHILRNYLTHNCKVTIITNTLNKPYKIIVLNATFTSLFLLLFLGGVATLNSAFGASVLGLLVSAEAEVGLWCSC